MHQAGQLFANQSIGWQKGQCLSKESCQIGPNQASSLAGIGKKIGAEARCFEATVQYWPVNLEGEIVINQTSQSAAGSQTGQPQFSAEQAREVAAMAALSQRHRLNPGQLWQALHPAPHAPY
ncbi:MAG: hypothetical protein WCW26_00200 [Candidatus Buchananbacteria bacterium]